MKIGNKENLPAGLVRAVQTHEHTGDVYSASMLSTPPRIVVLQKRHDAEIEEDVTDRLWAFFGTIGHLIAEKGVDPETEIAERKFRREVLPGVWVSGQSDLYSKTRKVVQDYKITSAWSVVYDSRQKEWEEQENVYAWFVEKEGDEVKGLEVVAIFRDWDKKKAGQGKYPKEKAKLYPIKLWDMVDREKWVKERVELFEANKNVPDDQLPFCTNEERWLNERTGKFNRCEGYCSVAKFCNQLQGGK